MGKALVDVEKNLLPPPKFIEDEGFFKTVLYHARIPFKDWSRNDRIRACYQHCCLMRTRNSMMTNASLRKRLGLDERNVSTVSRLITDAVKAKRIKRSDSFDQSRRAAAYVPFWA